MTLDGYQASAQGTATYPKDRDMGLAYVAIALGGEAGEVLNEVKKHLRDGGGIMTKERWEKVILEMGDTLWYLAAMATELGVTLSYVAEQNLKKLQERYAQKGNA